MNLREFGSVYRGHRVPHFKIIEHSRWWLALSGTLIVLSIIGLFYPGLTLSIDFKGGALITFEDHTGASVGDITQTMATFSRPNAEVQIVGGNQVSIRTESFTGDTEGVGALSTALAKQAGIRPQDVSVQDVGPTWGSEISRKALAGLVVVLVLITIYIWMRFEAKMAIGAMIAMFHDVLITAGVYVLVGREVTPETVIAILTILGFSLYDTVVIYDKIRENTESLAMIGREGYTGVVDRSLNQVLMRSVNTSLVVLLPITSLLLFGGATLKDFAFAMFVGVMIGAYSSIFVASPILVVLKEREPRYQQLRARAAQRSTVGRGARSAAEAGAVAAAAGSTPAAVAPAEAAAVASTRGGAAQAKAAGSRPRPKSKRKPPAKRKRR
jgi:preprotein translocase subunit SecF